MGDAESAVKEYQTSIHHLESCPSKSAEVLIFDLHQTLSISALLRPSLTLLQCSALQSSRVTSSSGGASDDHMISHAEKSACNFDWNIHHMGWCRLRRR